MLGLWGFLLAVQPYFFLTAYLPGYLVGLTLCYLHGHFEHARGTTSHYGLLYNLLFFNDGYHVEHHTRPAEHWTRLPKRRPAEATGSRWPAVLRWLEHFNLDGMERLVLRSQPLQRFVLRKHERAFRALLPGLGNVRRVELPRAALLRYLQSGGGGRSRRSRGPTEHEPHLPCLWARR